MKKEEKKAISLFSGAGGLDTFLVDRYRFQQQIADLFASVIEIYEVFVVNSLI